MAFASAAYLGSKIVHQIQAEEQNPALNLGFGPCTLYDATIGADLLRRDLQAELDRLLPALRALINGNK